MPDPRTVKSIEQRYDLRFNMRKSRRRFAMRAALAVCALTPLAYLAFASARDDRTIYWSRSVSTSHHFIQNDCSACHTKRFRPLMRMFAPGSGISSVDDHACAACHSESLHDHAAAMITSDVTHCAACHREHRGRPALARTPDAVCTNCHADLQTREGMDSSFARRISSFAKHPEFAVVRASLDAELSPGARHKALQLAERVDQEGNGEWRDRANIRFNHAKHLASAGVLLPWKQTGEAPAAPATKKLECRSCHEESSDGAYMKPVSYERHCAECHPLAFSEKLVPGGSLPHVAPELLRGVIRERLLEFAEQNPAVVTGSAGDDPRLPNKRTESTPSASDRWDWAEQELQRRQGDVFHSVSNGCAHCHIVESGDLAPFAIAPTNIPDRWLPHSRFRHDRHRVLQCGECHDAADSREAGDILMPSIDICRKCHGRESTVGFSGQVRSDCVQCHEYHHAEEPVIGRSLSELAPNRVRSNQDNEPYR